MGVTGYRLYMGKGGISQVDFSSPVAWADSSQSEIVSANAELLPLSRYTLVVRPVLDDLETPDVSCFVEVQTDAAGQWLGGRPPCPRQLSATVVSGNRVQLSWNCRTTEDTAFPAEFVVLCGRDATLADSQEIARVAYAGDGACQTIVNLVEVGTYWFVIQAVSSEGVESYRSNVVGPVLTDNQPPQTPTVFVATVF